jgi:hypothetical protein
MCRYVVNKVLQPMETTDPFADDFYFLQVTNCGANYFISWYFYACPRRFYWFPVLLVNSTRLSYFPVLFMCYVWCWSVEY